MRRDLHRRDAAHDAILYQPFRGQMAMPCSRTGNTQHRRQFLFNLCAYHWRAGASMIRQYAGPPRLMRVLLVARFH